MAARQPDFKDLNVLSKGVSRAKVIAEFGAPVLTEEKDGKKVDVFSFTQGYGRGNKVTRALLHAAADVYTLFLWEIIGTPAEIIASGKKMKIEVIYDKDEKVEQVNYLTAQKEVPKEKAEKTEVSKQPETLSKIIEQGKAENYSQYYRYVYNNILKLIKVEKGQSGTVNVELTISKDGQLLKVEILESSVPDESLREAVRKAAEESTPYPPFPDDMKNEPEKTFSLTYELRYTTGNAGIITSK